MVRNIIEPGRDLGHVDRHQKNRTANIPEQRLSVPASAEFGQSLADSDDEETAFSDSNPAVAGRVEVGEN